MFRQVNQMLSRGDITNQPEYVGFYNQSTTIDQCTSGVIQPTRKLGQGPRGYYIQLRSRNNARSGSLRLFLPQVGLSSPLVTVNDIKAIRVQVECSELYFVRHFVMGNSTLNTAL